MTDRRAILIGVDLGTSAVKVVAFDRTGGVLASAARGYPLAAPRPNWSEQNPEDWWKGTCAALRSLSREIDVARVAGLSFSGQMHGSVFLDRAGRVLRPAMLWNDGRTARQCEAIIERIGRKPFLNRIKNLPLTSFTLPKLLWLAEREPGHYRDLDCLLLPKDYVRYRMTGARHMDYSDAAGTVMLEVGRRRWASEMIEKLGLNPAVLPPLVESTAVVGGLTEEAAKGTGLRPGTPIVAGGGDQPVGAVGLGVLEEGQLMVSLGTSGVVLAPTRVAHAVDSGGLASFDHAVSGRSYLMGCVLSAGGALAWYRDALCTAEANEARKARRDVYELLLERAASIPAGSEELLFLPYLTGERTPHADPDARGAFFGLSLRHTHAHLTRALLEGVTFGLRDGLELIRQRGINLGEARATGGGARSPLWRQMLADVFNLPIRPVESEEGPALGAAILAGVGTGVFRNFAEASKSAIRVGRPVRPRAAGVRDYEAVYRRWTGLYPATRGLLARH